MSIINMAAWIACTGVEGPGLRAALWVQGCTLLCPGCCNPNFLRIAPRKLVATADVVGHVGRALETYGIEGITLLGGEPMLQAPGLSHLAEEVKSMGLTVMVFSGFTLEELRETPLVGAAELLASTDVLVAGRYRADEPDVTRNWVGSRNQKFHYLSERYDAGIEGDGLPQREIEIRLGRDGTVTANGWPWITSGSLTPRSRPPRTHRFTDTLGATPTTL